MLVSELGHNISMAVSIVADFAYGYKPQPKADPLLENIKDISQLFSLASRPGAYLVDNIPIRQCSFVYISRNVQ